MQASGIVQDVVPSLGHEPQPCQVCGKRLFRRDRWVVWNDPYSRDTVYLSCQACLENVRYMESEQLRRFVHDRFGPDAHVPRHQWGKY